MKNKERTILCMLIAMVFLIPLIGNTAVAATTTYCFSEYDPLIAWETNPQYIADCDEHSTMASTTIDDDVELLYEPITSGGTPDTITKVEIRVCGYFTGGCYAWIILRPVFRLGEGDDHNWSLPGTACWSPWFDITEDTNAPDPWTIDDVTNLKVKVIAGMPTCPGPYITLYCSKVEMRVTWTS